MCVGVFLLVSLEMLVVSCLPHVRGGVSLTTMKNASVTTVFPMCVGVFPACKNEPIWICRLPHVCGGVSAVLCALSAALLDYLQIVFCRSV